MTTHDLCRPRRPASAGHALEEAGFFLAEQVLSREASLREARDDAFRQEVASLRELVRPQVFPDRESRDAACRGPMPGGVFALRPTTADAQRHYSDSGCPFAVGPRLTERGFEKVASAIVDFEVRKLVDRCASENFDDAPAHFSSRSVVLAVSVAFFQVRLVGRGGAEVEAIVPFDALSTDEVAMTAGWILQRMGARKLPN